MRFPLRLFTLTVLFFATSTGVVMASSTACRIAVVDQLRAAQVAVHRRVHHSAVTLARWKVGAAAWSKAHGGKVYAGVPAPRRQDWTPLTFKCDDVALDLSRPDEDLPLSGEPSPGFTAYRDRAPFPQMPRSELDLAAAQPPEVEDVWEQASSVPFTPALVGGGPGFLGGNAVDSLVGPASFPPVPLPPLLAAPIPAPESPTIVLLGTGMLSFLVTKLRRRTVV